MTYFIFRLCLACLVSALLLLYFLRSLKRCRRERCKHPLMVFLPTLLALLVLLQVVYTTAPKLLDFLDLMRRSLAVKQVTVVNRQALPGILKTSDEEVYQYNPFALEFVVGKHYNVTYTTRSRFIISIDEIER